MIDSFNSGVAAEFLAASVLIDLGYDVLLPFDRRGKYDLAAITPDGKFVKFQVKKATWFKPLHTTSSYLRVQTASKGVKYSEKDIDYFLFVCPERRVWMIPVDIICHKQTLMLDKRTFSKRTWKTNEHFDAESYRIA
jgi:hypothetical protein